MFKECVKSVFRVFQECFKNVFKVFNGSRVVEGFKTVPRFFQECFKNVSRDVQDYFKIAARVLEEGFICF